MNTTHAAGEVYKVDGWWVGSWFDAEGRRHRRRLALLKGEAQRILDEKRGIVRKEAILGRPEAVPIRFGDFATVFYQRHCRPVQSESEYSRSWFALRLMTVHFGGTFREGADVEDTSYPEGQEPFAGGLYVHQLTTDKIQAWMTWRLTTPTKGPLQKKARCPGAYTVNKELCVLRRMLRAAKASRHTLDNPALDVKPMKWRTAIRETLTPAEFETLYRCAADHLKPMLRVMVDAGLRPCEAYALRREDCNLDRGTVSIVQSKTGIPKTIRLSSGALAEVAGVIKEGMDARPQVFRDDEGEPYKSKSGCKRAWRTACKRSWQETGNGKFRRLTPYCIRHTTGTWLGDAGLSESIIGARLGHAPTSIVTRQYVHSADPGGRAVAVMEAVQNAQKSVGSGKKVAMEGKGGYAGVSQVVTG
jgi:integrase